MSAGTTELNAQTAPTVAILFHGTLHIGGVENHLLSLFRHMPGLGAHGQPRWLIFSAASTEFSARAGALGARVINWTPRRAWDVAAFQRLVRLLQNHQVTVIHSHSPLAAWHGGLAGRWLHRRALVTIHLPLYDYVQSTGWLAGLKRQAYIGTEAIIEHWLADWVIFVSAAVHREALARRVASARSSSVVANGIDQQALKPTQPRAALRLALGALPGALVLCSVCRLVYQKGVDVLLAALAHLPADVSWQLWLVGDGPARGELEAQARGLGLSARVHFLGFRSNIADLLSASDIFVLASRAEASPLALMEAMTLGKPAVVTAVGENALLVAGNAAGLLVPPNDAAALTAALRQLMTDDARRAELGLRACQAAAAFDDRRMAAETGAVYESLLGSR